MFCGCLDCGGWLRLLAWVWMLIRHYLNCHLNGEILTREFLELVNYFVRKVRVMLVEPLPSYPSATPPAPPVQSRHPLKQYLQSAHIPRRRLQNRLPILRPTE